MDKLKKHYFRASTHVVKQISKPLNSSHVIPSNPFTCNWGRTSRYDVCMDESFHLKVKHLKFDYAAKSVVFYTPSASTLVRLFLEQQGRWEHQKEMAKVMSSNNV